MNVSSLKDKLNNISKKNGKTFNEIFKQLMFERFLARLAMSKYRETFVFKGGQCLSHYIDINRETKDLDFLIKSKEVNKEFLKDSFSVISGLNLDDGFTFEQLFLNELTTEHKKYPGFRIKIPVSFGKIKDSLQIDLGVGDFVIEEELKVIALEYKNEPLLGELDISILAYPPEYIFSEKIHAIIDLKALNSRMKDYYDCYLLIKSNTLDELKTLKALQKTFHARKSNLIPIHDYSNELQKSWALFSKKIESDNLKIKTVIETINSFIQKIQS